CLQHRAAAQPGKPAATAPAGDEYHLQQPPAGYVPTVSSAERNPRSHRGTARRSRPGPLTQEGPATITPMKRFLLSRLGFRDTGPMLMSKVSRQVVIRNRLGLHARPAMQFVDLANKFEATIKVHKGGDEPVEADGKSVMQMII